MGDLRDIIVKALEPYDIPTNAWTPEERREPAYKVIDALTDNPQALIDLLVENGSLSQVGWIDYPAPAGTLHEDDEGGCIPVYSTPAARPSSSGGRE